MVLVNIRTLKNELSAYLDRVRNGEEILIKDRDTVIARIIPFETNDLHEQERELFATGQMKPPTRRKSSDLPSPAPTIGLETLKQALGGESK
jgi:prevent-host-death family protein